MAVRVLSSEKSHRRNLPSVAISPKLKRLTLNKLAYELLSRKYGKKVEYAQILVDDEQKGVFWVKPTERESYDCKRLDSPSANTRSLSISVLLTEFNWSLQETSRYKIEWDEDLKAGKVDTSRRLDPEKKGNED
ncbi:MAG: hypothetical protein ACLQMS_13175 [Desulfomonilaceae bacterium]